MGNSVGGVVCKRHGKLTLSATALLWLAQRAYVLQPRVGRIRPTLGNTLKKSFTPAGIRVNLRLQALLDMDIDSDLGCYIV
jgi:hypothetical protein